jgi:hypothetical protein
VAGGKPARVRPPFGIAGVEVRGFRTAREVSFSPSPLCALVGEADAGKSNLLAAIRAVLDPAAAPVTAADAAEDGAGRISIRVKLVDGGEAALERRAGDDAPSADDAGLPVVFLPAEACTGTVLAGGGALAEGAGEVAAVLQRELTQRRSTSAGRALSLVDALESACTRRTAGVLLLIGEPELYLRPQAQRYLYRLLREFSLAATRSSTRRTRRRS